MLASAIPFIWKARLILTLEAPSIPSSHWPELGHTAPLSARVSGKVDSLVFLNPKVEADKKEKIRNVFWVSQ